MSSTKKGKTVIVTVNGSSKKLGEFRVRSVNGGTPIITRATGGKISAIPVEKKPKLGSGKKN